MKIIRSATRIVVRTSYAPELTIDEITAERLESMEPAEAERLVLFASVASIRQIQAHRSLRTVPVLTLAWRGLSFGRDYFEVALYGPEGLLAAETIDVVTLPLVGARDREREALARAHRAAGIALSVGGAQ